MSLRSMWRPLGRPNCPHSARNFPSWSKIWMRSFERSATNSRPLESMARAWGMFEFTLSLARFAPGLDEFSVLRELHDARVRLLSVSVGDEDVAIGRDQDVGRPIEGLGPFARDPRLAQRHQHLSIGAELDDRVALAVAASAVGHPDVAIPVREQAVRPIDHAGTEARHQLARGVELLDRRDIRALAGLCAAPRCRLRSPAPTRGPPEASPNSLLRDRDWVRHWDPRHALALPIKPSSRRRRRRASISRDHACHVLPLQIVLALFLDSLNRHSLTSTSGAAISRGPSPNPCRSR